MARRRAWLTMHPYCAKCEKQGIFTLGTTPDHIVPLGEGGADDCTNLQTLCDPCHAEKSKAEQARGRDRGRVGQEFGD